MRFMLLIHQGETPTPDDPDAWGRLTPDEQQAVWADYRALAETPGVTPGERMAAPAAAKTVRVEEGRPVITDGPFAETREALGGYLFLEADGPETALAVAARIPAARLGGAVEVRPLVG
jgi:hypothetical protein